MGIEMRFFLILLLITIQLCGNALFSQNEKVKPVIEFVSKMPDLESMKRKELQKELINYYSKALALQSQLIAINEIPLISVPSLPEPLPTKSKILRSEVAKYFDIGKKLNTQILELENTSNLELRNKIRELQKAKDVAEKELFINEISVKASSDSVNNLYLKKMSAMYQNNFRNSVPIMSISVLGNQFFWKNDFAESDPSLGVRVDFNSLPLLGSSDVFEIYTEYLAPNFSTIIYDKAKNAIKTSWRSDLYAVGASINFPSRFEFDGFSAGLKLGGGYFWGNGKVYNAEQIRNDWKGGNLRFELNLRKYTKFYPLEAYIAYSVYFPNNSFDFNRLEGKVLVAENSMSSLSLGLRMCFWWIPIQ